MYYFRGLDRLDRSFSNDKNIFDSINVTQLITGLPVLPKHHLIKSGVLSDSFSEHSVFDCLCLEHKNPHSSFKILSI